MNDYRVKIDTVLRLPFGTADETRAAADADVMPAVLVRRQGVAMAYAPTVVHVDTGAYEAVIDCTAANGFLAEQEYSAFVSVTIDGRAGVDGLGLFRVVEPTGGFGEHAINETIRIPFGVADVDGIAADASSPPTVLVRKDGVPLLYAPVVSHVATGKYEVVIELSAVNGFTINAVYTVFAFVEIEDIEGVDGIASFYLMRHISGNPDIPTTTPPTPVSVAFDPIPTIDPVALALERLPHQYRGADDVPLELIA